MNEKQFLIRDLIGNLYIFFGESAIDAFAKWATCNTSMTKDWFVTRKQLIKRDFVALNTTRIENVWELVKSEN